MFLITERPSVNALFSANSWKEHQNGEQTRTRGQHENGSQSTATASSAVTFTATLPDTRTQTTHLTNNELAASLVKNTVQLFV